VNAAECKYYDGKSPVPVKGWVTLSPDSVSFESKDERVCVKIRFDYNDIVDVFRKDGQTHVELDDKTEKDTTHLLIFSNDKLHDELLSYRKLKSKNIFKKFAITFSKISLVKKGVILSSSLAVVIFLILTFTNMIYMLVPVSVDTKIGEYATNILCEQSGVLRDTKKIRHLKKLMKDLVPSDTGFEYRICIINRPDVNALALPGGRIIIFNGLLRESKNDSELSGVIAHEISHVELRHGIRQIIKTIGIAYITKIFIGTGFEEIDLAETLSELSGFLLVFKNSREFEKEADLMAVSILHNSGNSIKGMISFFRRLSEKKDPGSSIPWLSTHPSAKDRSEYLVREYEKEKRR